MSARLSYSPSIIASSFAVNFDNTYVSSLCYASSRLLLCHGLVTGYIVSILVAGWATTYLYGLTTASSSSFALTWLADLFSDSFTELLLLSLLSSLVES